MLTCNEIPHVRIEEKTHAAFRIHHGIALIWYIRQFSNKIEFDNMFICLRCIRQARISLIQLNADWIHSTKMTVTNCTFDFIAYDVAFMRF